jgi:hypothetical protein
MGESQEQILQIIQWTNGRGKHNQEETVLKMK